MLRTRWILPILIVGAAWLPTAALIGAAPAAGRAPQAASPPQSSSADRVSPGDSLLRTYCVRCHSQRLHIADLSLEGVDPAAVGRDAAVWEKVVRKLHMGAMPPPGAPRPDQPATDAFVKAVEEALDREAAQHPNPGRTDTLHRLNRAEYQNAVRDLLSLDIDVASMLPADDADIHGFDNMAGLLSISPALLERYMSAARKVSRLALGVSPPGPVTDTYSIPDLAQQDGQTNEELPFGSRGGLAVRHYFPVDGEYLVKIRLRRQIYDYITGLDQPERLEVRIDGQRVKAFKIGGDDHGRSAPQSFAGDVLGDPQWERYALTADAELQVRVPVKASDHLVGVSFVGTFTEPEGVLQPRQRYGDYSRDESREQGVESVAISGPYGTKDAAVSDTPSRRSLLVCRPSRPADDESCAKTILARLARRAYRRPATDAEVQTLVGFFKTGRAEGGFNGGLQFALERILADPNFLFRVERDPAAVPANTAYRISDLELASRLSFFLWSSIPDDELLEAAIRGNLKQPAVLARQVARLLADPRSKALVDNFAGQWLLLRNIRSVRPEPDLFPDFDEELRASFERESEIFMESQLREDRSLLELIGANYTFVNERLARHYQIPNIHGANFRRVTFPPEDQRGGLIGQGSLLMVTAYPNRTSPVLRGKWILDSLLGAPPPQPPPNVPSLKDRGENGRPASVRERLEQHRRDPACATCHSQMDPLGFALENFDAIGKWRTQNEAGTPVDASGALPTGAKFEGPRGLRTFLLSRREQFVNAVTEKLLSYAIGRAIDHYDMPAVRQIVRGAAANDYRWSSIVMGIVQSAPFQMRMSQPADAGRVAATFAFRLQPSDF
jgi:mono/diheme cytochrome c family protein